MLWIKAFHIIFMVTWFAGIFYLPRLFVYHAMTKDAISLERFITMEQRLYYAIILPSSILTTACGLCLFFSHPAFYFQAGWMEWKLIAVGGVWVYQFRCNYYRKCFKQNKALHSALFYRWFNEIPSILLCVIVILVVIKP